MRLHWRLVDRLKGLILLDEARPGGPKFRSFQETFLARIDRWKVAVAGDTRMIEKSRYHDHLADLAADEERRWQDYLRRLSSDAAATPDVDGGHA